MKHKSAYFVVGIGVVFFIASICRLFGSTVPGLVVALISVIAALITLSDVLEITKYKKYCNVLQGLALLFLIIALIFWIFPFVPNVSIIQNVGDSFTIMGLGLVIGLYGLKEILEHKREKNHHTKNKIYDEYKFRITKNEYDELMKLNDIIERLKMLDQETLPKNRLHDGWAQFSDTLTEHFQRFHGEPFYDGMNRQKFSKFIRSLDNAAEQISDIANTDYHTLTTKKVDIGLNIDEVSIQPRMNSMYISSIDDVYKELKEAINVWDEFKDSVSKRYEKERAELRKEVKID